MGYPNDPPSTAGLNRSAGSPVNGAEYLGPTHMPPGASAFGATTRVPRLRSGTSGSSLALFEVALVEVSGEREHWAQCCEEPRPKQRWSQLFRRGLADASACGGLGERNVKTRASGSVLVELDTSAHD